MKTKKEIKLQTIKDNRNEIMEAIKEEISGSDLSLKQAMELFLGARTKDPSDFTMVMCNGLQAVTKAAEKIGDRKAKRNNRVLFMSDHAKRMMSESIH